MPHVQLPDITSFSKKLFALLLLVAYLVGPQAASAQYVDGKLRGVSVDDWQGWMILKGGKGYASSPMGQVHYRDIGPRDYKYPIVLLHQSPMSMIQWAPVQNELANMGVRAITVDTPGYGTSDLPDKQPTIPEFADNLVHVLDHLKLDKVVVAGHHTGSQIAVSFAGTHPDRVAAVVLHGAAQLNEEERARYLALNRTPRTPLPDGSHLSRSWRPQTPPLSQAMLDARNLVFMTAYIQGPDIGHWAAYHYDMLPDLMSIKTPGMILSDVGDAIHYIDLRVAELRPDFKYVEFSKGGSTIEFMVEPKRWATIVADFLATIDDGEKRTGLGQ